LGLYKLNAVHVFCRFIVHLEAHLSELYTKLFGLIGNMERENVVFPLRSATAVDIRDSLSLMLAV